MNKSIITVTLNPALDKTITIDRFNYGSLNRVISSRLDAGGKGINVAKVLTKFGMKAIATGLMAGATGEAIFGLLKDYKIYNSFINIPGEIRTNLKVVEAETKIITEINEPGFNVDEEQINKLLDSLRNLLDETDMLILSGSLPSGVNTDIYKKMILMAKEKNVPAILDADGEALKKGLEAKPWAIKPNKYELEKLLGYKLSTDEDIVTVAKDLISSGIGNVVVSLGAEGAILVNNDQVLQTRVFPVEIQSTVAAGDSMVAALAYSNLTGFDFQKTASFITAAGTITASKPGSEVCSLEEVSNRVDEVVVNDISNLLKTHG